jgi:hypothetical protein
MKHLLAIALLLTGCAAPAPQATPAPSPGGKVSIKFRAALLRKNGDQIKVARTTFTAGPESPEEVAKAAEALNKGLIPPSVFEPKPKGIEFTTDLNGEADIQLEPGRWYFAGKFNAGANGSAYWIGAPIDVTATTKVIELSNDNATDIVVD